MRLNRHDEWSSLREVILGSAADRAKHEREIPLAPFSHGQPADRTSFHDHMDKRGISAPRSRRTPPAVAPERSPIGKRCVS